MRKHLNNHYKQLHALMKISMAKTQITSTQRDRKKNTPINRIDLYSQNKQHMIKFLRLNLNSYLALQTEVSSSNKTNNNKKTAAAAAKTRQPWPQINQAAKTTIFVYTPYSMHKQIQSKFTINHKFTILC